MSISRDWEAYYVKSMGGDPEVLHIVGTFDFPMLGYTVDFEDANPGPVPGTVAFKLKINEPPVGGAKTDTRQIEHLVSQRGVKQVRIQEGEESFFADVYEVS
jgi:hypothetical protein